MTKQKTFGGMCLSLFFSPSFCVRVCVCAEGPACPFRRCTPFINLVSRRKCGRNRKDFRFVIRSAQRDLENWIRNIYAPCRRLKKVKTDTQTNLRSHVKMGVGKTTYNSYSHSPSFSLLRMRLLINSRQSANNGICICHLHRYVHITLPINRIT